MFHKLLRMQHAVILVAGSIMKPDYKKNLLQHTWILFPAVIQLCRSGNKRFIWLRCWRRDSSKSCSPQSLDLGTPGFIKSCLCSKDNGMQLLSMVQPAIFNISVLSYLGLKSSLNFNLFLLNWSNVSVVMSAPPKVQTWNG